MSREWKITLGRGAAPLSVSCQSQGLRRALSPVPSAPLLSECDSLFLAVDAVFFLEFYNDNSLVSKSKSRLIIQSHTLLPYP